jgi:hypothetical protein
LSDAEEQSDAEQGVNAAYCEPLIPEAFQFIVYDCPLLIATEVVEEDPVIKLLLLSKAYKVPFE